MSRQSTPEEDSDIEQDAAGSHFCYGGAFEYREGPPSLETHDKIPSVILDRVTRFLTSPESASFDELALVAFAWQFERVEAYRRLCERRGATPETVRDWRRVPPVPAAAFKTMTLAAAPA